MLCCCSDDAVPDGVRARLPAPPLHSASSTAAIASKCAPLLAPVAVRAAAALLPPLAAPSLSRPLAVRTPVLVQLARERSLHPAHVQHLAHLLAAGADEDARDTTHGRTALAWAVQRGSVAAVRAVLQQPAASPSQSTALLARFAQTDNAGVSVLQMAQQQLAQHPRHVGAAEIAALLSAERRVWRCYLRLRVAHALTHRTGLTARPVATVITYLAGNNDEHVTHSPTLSSSRSSSRRHSRWGSADNSSSSDRAAPFHSSLD